MYLDSDDAPEIMVLATNIDQIDLTLSPHQDDTGMWPEEFKPLLEKRSTYVNRLGELGFFVCDGKLHKFNQQTERA